MSGAVLLRRAEILSGEVTDIRLRGGLVVARGELQPGENEQVIEAAGGALLPGLHDHHVHVAATAAAMASVRCGPPEVTDAAGLAAVLGTPGENFIRGIGYHESVTGGVLINRQWLDGVAPQRPVRVQHRTGRLWVFNSAGLEILLAAGAAPAGLDVQTGQLFDDDGFVRRALGGKPPSFAAVGAAFSSFGVTGLTEMSPDNDDATADYFADERLSGALPQRVLLAGRLELSQVDMTLTLGPVKLHLHEAQLPALDATVALMRAAHARGRVVAVHCVTLTELVFTLAALREAGVMPGDRIEHASVVPDEQLREIAALGLAVVLQPNFVAERGDEYLAEIAPAEWPQLYRLRAFADAGVTCAGGSDTPFGSADPWAAMAAAVSRKTRRGQVLGLNEALTPEAALNLFLADPLRLGQTRRIAVGMPADLCLLDRPWRAARTNLSAALVKATWIGGRLIYDRIDQPPGEGLAGVDALA
jgi:predicted amidohydrolase YtcJ